MTKCGSSSSKAYAVPRRRGRAKAREQSAARRTRAPGRRVTSRPRATSARAGAKRRPSGPTRGAAGRSRRSRAPAIRGARGRRSSSGSRRGSPARCSCRSRRGPGRSGQPRPDDVSRCVDLYGTGLHDRTGATLVAGERHADLRVRGTPAPHPGEHPAVICRGGAERGDVRPVADAGRSARPARRAPRRCEPAEQNEGATEHHAEPPGRVNRARRSIIEGRRVVGCRACWRS